MFLVAQMVVAQCTKYYSNCSLTVLFVLELTFHMYTFPVHENISSGKKSCALNTFRSLLVHARYNLGSFWV